ncbi:MAG TPA: c-type cytochrome domain-containing protein [Verrucomicrobiae bacterium]|nr:c-type cytochrome domain-containing protein [Verrucomicrobiae bacterium]
MSAPSNTAQVARTPGPTPGIGRGPFFRTVIWKRLAVLLSLPCLAGLPSFAGEKVTYQDNVLPLVEANCAKCHNSDRKKADLDLTTYQGILKGSGSGEVVLSGNVEGSKIWKALTHSEEPYMPPHRPPLDAKALEVFKKWIAGGLIEKEGGRAVAASAPAFDLALKPGAQDKPSGPPPMPEHLSLQPVVHTRHTTAITGLASSPWAPLVAVAGQKQVLLYNSDTLALLGILPFPEGEPVQVKFSASGKLLLACGGIGARSGCITAWDVVSGARSLLLGGEYDTVLTADMRPDQTQVASGGPSRLVKIRSTRTGEVLQKIKKHTDWVTAVAFSPDGAMLASADRNGGISVWDPDSGQELFTLAGHKAAVTALSWRTDSKLLASASEDGTVRIWELKEGKQVKSWTAHPGGALCVAYSRDGKLVTCGRDNRIVLWAANGSRIRSLPNAPELPVRVIFSHDGNRIFAADFSGHVHAWNVKDGKRCGELDANPPIVASGPPSARKKS